MKELIHNAILKNQFAVLSDLKGAFSPFEDDKGRWHRISITGELDICDYNAGLVHVSLYVCEQVRQVDGGYNKLWPVHLHIGTLDDDGWDAWSKYFESEDEGKELLDRVKNVLYDLHILPTGDRLNELLFPYGMYGEINP